MDILLPELYQALGHDISISNIDIAYLVRRLKAEGVRFATIELPKVARAVISGLETGFFDRTTLTSFRFNASTLCFCKELLNKVFCRNTGLLLSVPCGEAILAIRQLCEFTYKLALPYTEKQIDEANKSFIKTDEEIGEVGKDPKVIVFANDLRKDFETYYADLSSKSISFILGGHRPRATPGTFVGSGNLFYIEKVAESNRVYPKDCRAMSGYYKPYPSAKVSLTPVDEAMYSELLLVPKDSRGPRTICREHLHRVETQMSFFDFVSRSLTKISEGAINFVDQTVNRRIAEESSVTKRYATLDLKDASDRVSFNVVKVVFNNSPGLRWFLKGSRRATHVKVDNDLRKLNKLAGMGSGLTFPTMALLISLAICNQVKKRFGGKYEDIRKDVFVYGDDICVPSLWVECAMRGLSLIGLHVNVNKSFTRGAFRESCGADFFAGLDVSPLRMRLANSKVTLNSTGGVNVSDNANTLKQIYELARELYKRGFSRACKHVMGLANKIHYGLTGTQMSPGKFDAECNLFLDFTRGTAHISVEALLNAYTVRPSQHRELDDHSIIDKKGRCLKLDPLKRLAQELAPSPTRPRAICTLAEEIAIDRMDPVQSLPFGEITIPRNLDLIKRVVRAEYHIESPGFSRDYWLSRVRSDKFAYLYSLFTMYSVCHSAYF